MSTAASSGGSWRHASASGSGASVLETDIPIEETQAERGLQKTPSSISAPYSIYKTWEKRVLAISVALLGSISPVSAQIYLPALTPIAKDLNVSGTKINLTITTYMIFQGIVPMFVGAFADSGGRRPAFIACFSVYLAANIGLALAPNYAAVLALRCLQSAGSSSTIALSNAVIADVITSAERGQYVSITVIPVVLAPAVGPIIGGLLSQHLGWRSVFWFLVIVAGLMLALILVFYPETCRHIVGNGSTMPPPFYRSLWQALKHRRNIGRTNMDDVDNGADEAQQKRRFSFKPPNVLASVLMLFRKDSGLILWTSSISFAGFYCNSVAIPNLFSERYGYDETTVGLMYLPLAAGSLAAAAIVGPAMNWNYRRHCYKAGVPFDRKRQADIFNLPIERARLEIGIPLLSIAGICLVVWGWVMHLRLHVAVHCVVSFFMGIGFIGLNNSVNALLVDIHPGQAGTAIAANNLTRCLIGAGATAATLPLIKAWGVGGTFTFIGALYFAGAVPLSLVAAKGMKWRQQKLAKNEEEKEATSSR
jgi:MFS family permease